MDIGYEGAFLRCVAVAQGWAITILLVTVLSTSWRGYLEKIEIRTPRMEPTSFVEEFRTYVMHETAKVVVPFANEAYM